MSEMDKTKCAGKCSNRSRIWYDNLGKHTQNLSLVLRTLVLNKDRLIADKGKVTLANKHQVHILQHMSQSLEKDTGQVLIQEWR